MQLPAAPDSAIYLQTEKTALPWIQVSLAQAPGHTRHVIRRKRGIEHRLNLFPARPICSLDTVRADGSLMFTPSLKCGTGLPPPPQLFPAIGQVNQPVGIEGMGNHRGRNHIPGLLPG